MPPPPPPPPGDSWLDEAIAHGLRFPAVGARAAAPRDAVCVSLVAYEEVEWIDALLANAQRHAPCHTHTSPDVPYHARVCVCTAAAPLSLHTASRRNAA